MSLPWFLNLCSPQLVFKTAILLLIISSLIAYYKWWSKSPFHGANKGPKIYPLLGCLPEVLRNNVRRYDWVTDYMKKSPGLTMRYRYPPFGTLIYTANPINVEYILKTKFDNYPKGERTNGALRPLLGHGIFNIDGHLWKAQRKVASHEFTARSLRDFVVDALRHETHSRLLPFLSRAAIDGDTIDLQNIFMRFAFDNICLIGFGVDTGCLDISLPHSTFAAAFEEAVRLCIRRFLLPSFLSGTSNKQLSQAVQAVDEFAMSVISSRREELSKRQSSQESLKSDLLSRFIGLADQNTKGMTQKENDIYIRDMIVNFLLAGRDTSSSTLTLFFLLLSNHPEVEAKIWTELENVMSHRYSTSANDPSLVKEAREKHINDPLGEKGFAYDELKQMNYLHAALTETLRLYPAVPSDTKTCLADDVWPDGTVVRKGERVGFHPYAMGRMEALWGKDCLEFRPDRWLENGSFIQQSPYKFTAFQAGPRICLGKDMAMIQMKYVAASIIVNGFKLAVLPGQSSEYAPSFTLKLKNGLLCKVSHARRQPTR